MKAWLRAPAILLGMLVAYGCSVDAAAVGGDLPDAPQNRGPHPEIRSVIASEHEVGTAVSGGGDPLRILDFADDLPPSPELSPPEMMGLLIGPKKKAEPEGVEFFGTDMGLTFEHRGELYMLFGDTWAKADTVCEPMQPNDDIIGVLPARNDGGMPRVQLLTDPESPRKLKNTFVYRDGKSLPMGFGRAPIAGFSDGERSFAIVQRLEPTRCEETTGSAPTCGNDASFSCEQEVGVCDPPVFPLTALCDSRESPTSPTNGCLPNQTCVKSQLCVDVTASQYVDGSFQGRQGAVAYTTEIAAARADEPTTYDSVLSLPTNKFAMPNTRTVARFTGRTDGNDYSGGHDTLLYWGRSGHVAENGRESQLYLMTHRLPLPIDDAGKLDFQPLYFAGLDPFNEPIWSPEQSQAKPIALDGRVGGSPHEVLQIIGMYTISWLGAPINKWMMLYGGDLADFLMLNPDASRSTWQPGSIFVRWADHPWGPFSPPQPYLSPGHPQQRYSGYGPGGFMYHPDCRDQGDLRCARSDAHRPPDVAVDCQVQVVDPGRLYQPNIIDNYVRPTADGGLEVLWNVSTWNPYGVQLVKSRVYPPGHPTRLLDVELADRQSLSRLADWGALPEFGFPRRYVQQSSRDRGRGGDFSIPLSRRGNRDFNNFVCVSRDARYPATTVADLRFDQTECDEPYVRGAVMARFEGAGYLVRTWLSALSLAYGPADDEMLRIYVDDDPRPVIDVPLVEALDGRAGEIFAPPFGAGSPLHLSWYYPIAFRRKLIVALDGLGTDDLYYHQSDAVLDLTPLLEPPARERLPHRDQAALQLSERYQPAGVHDALREPVAFELAAGASEVVRVDGPATIHEFRIRFADAELSRLAGVKVQVAWNDAFEPAIDLPLLDLLGGSVPPEQTSLAMTSYVEGRERVLALKLPMPFERSAELRFTNTGRLTAKFELRLNGERDLRLVPFGKLHAQLNETMWPTNVLVHHAAVAQGRGKLVGVCGQLEGHAQAGAGAQYDHLNFLEGDVHANIDGALALDGTGTEAYADDAFYYINAPHATPFAQTWGVRDTLQPPARASFCRWHVLGTELEFQQSLDLTFELGGQMNPTVVDRYRTVAYLYLDD